MDFIGKRVKHSAFGEGEIVAQKGTMLSVKFDDTDEIKKFVEPDCFKTFLVLLDSEAAAQTEETLRRRAEAEQAAKEKRLKDERERAFKRMQESSRGHKGVDLPPFLSVADFCEAYKRSLISEIMFLKSNGGKRQKLYDGKRVEVKRGRILYTFEADSELSFPDGTQITIWRGLDSVGGSIIGCEEFTVILAAEKDLGMDVPLIEFSAEPWRLMSALVTQLEEFSQSPSEITRMLVCEGRKAIEMGNPVITRGQDTAVQMAQSQPITFIWGPPGTGKTQTLARIALAHIKKGNRVLVLSYSNVSVDGAVMRVHQLSEDKKPGVLVRYGYPRQKDLLEHEYLTSYNLTIRNHPDLLRERKRLLDERKKYDRKSVEYIHLSQKIKAIRAKLVEEEKLAVRHARFVATTVSKTVVDSVVFEGSFDVVIFDEASMAYIPQIVFASALAKKHFICIGDFRQLPPIVQSSKDSPLNADVFQYCGIAMAVDRGRNHKWLCMLDTQYRMHPDIAAFASKSMYGDRLISHGSMERERQAMVSKTPISEHAIGFADLSGMMSVCMKTADGSHINVLSAFISFALALDAPKYMAVGVITPYYAQSRLLHAMARDAMDADPARNPISCATVHQFQGSEKDVIIYDAVDCYRIPFPGMLLTSTGNNYANRLFNVALTRAKGKFVGVANVDYMDNKNLSKNLMFRKLIDQQRMKTSCLSGWELSKSRTLGNAGLMRFFDDETGVLAFLRDIVSAKKDIRVDIPDSPVENQSLTEIAKALQAAKRKGIKVVVRAENKQTLPPAMRIIAIENEFVANPVATIDGRISWFGMPGSNAEFLAEGMRITTRHRPVIRFVGFHTAKSLYGFMEMNKTTDQSKTADTDAAGHLITDSFANYVLANKKCPSCRKPMRLQKSKKGSFFYGCTGYPGCREMEFPEVDFVERYFYRYSRKGQLCPRCGFSLEAIAGKFGVFVQCCGRDRHIFKLDEI